MRECISLWTVLLLGTAASVCWGRTMWYCDERSSVVRRLVFFAMGRTHMSRAEVRSWVLTAVYYVMGLLLALSLALVSRFSFTALFSFRQPNTLGGGVVLGIIGEISLTSLLVELGIAAIGSKGRERFAELQEIPWIKGLQELPPRIVPLVAAIGGGVEEFFFRGVLLGILVHKAGMTPSRAIVIAGFLFCLQQLLQLRTPFQAMVIVSSCIAISTVGGLLVLATRNVVPAILCHVSFVVFFMAQNMRGHGKARVEVSS